MRSLLGGFTLLEVLIAMTLLAILFLGIADALWIAQAANDRAWKQTIASEELNEVGCLFALQPNNLSQLVSQWEQDVAILLPDGKGSLMSREGQRVAVVSWRSTKQPLWLCHTAREKARDCVERQF
ncbi:MAG: prepilin-type N-terminal cleavage/methylation domain-containing protein [Pseudomonadota bacterium]|nr:prepilin-type N-terminal cleavage/methylation domain-containing protein [Gammaproteobacteria bacterium]